MSQCGVWTAGVWCVVAFAHTHTWAYALTRTQLCPSPLPSSPPPPPLQQELTSRIDALFILLHRTALRASCGSQSRTAPHRKHRANVTLPTSSHAAANAAADASAEGAGKAADDSTGMLQHRLSLRNFAALRSDFGVRSCSTRARAHTHTHARVANQMLHCMPARLAMRHSALSHSFTHVLTAVSPCSRGELSNIFEMLEPDEDGFVDSAELVQLSAPLSRHNLRLGFESLPVYPPIRLSEDELGDGIGLNLDGDGIGLHLDLCLQFLPPSPAECTLSAPTLLPGPHLRYVPHHCSLHHRRPLGWGLWSLGGKCAGQCAWRVAGART